ncbi:MAG TPA: HEAT repeat domain-containing protein [Pyrinomonadaceae bacterium]|nr:HEAT repeat domain-containing protein [Pyrinomonadaceae bacterium]
MNQQVKAKLTAVRDFLSGRSGEPKVEADKATRDEVAAELLATMSGEFRRPGSMELEVPTESNEMRETSDSDAGTRQLEPDEQKRARQLFLDQGYFEDTIESLRPGRSSAERAAAARALGLLGSDRATPHLIAATFDDDAEVRAAAEDALRQISDPTTASVAAETTHYEESPTVDEAVTISSSISEAEAVSVDLLPEVSELDQTATAELAQSLPDVSSATELTVSEVELRTAAASVEPLASTFDSEVDDQLTSEEQAVQERLKAVDQQISALVAASKQAENEVRWRAEREGQLRAEAEARRLEDEELRKRAEEESQTRRMQEREAMMLERQARVNAEVEMERHATEEKDLRLQFATLRGEIAEFARRRSESEFARAEAAETARLAEAFRVRDEARSQHQSELEALGNEEERLKRTAEELRQQQDQLRIDIDHLHEAGEQIAKQRAEVDAARAKADAELEELAQAQLRMREAERARAQAETERAEIEADLNRQLEAHQRELEEARLRQQQERERLREELRLLAATEKAHSEELLAMKARADEESSAFAEQEHQILSEIDKLRMTDAETRRRIEDAESRRRASEEAYRLIAEKVQRVEAEAYARTKEEEQMLAKLETERRQVAVEAQSRADQAKRIREEIEMFRRLEAEERPRIEAATLQLADAEERLRDQKARLQELSASRSLVEDEARTVEHSPATPPALVQAEVAAESFAGEDDLPAGSPAVSPTISTFLGSIDPYKRAAAVTELARAHAPDAFARITECFDDHSPHVRNAAARALRKLEPARAVDLFNRALEQASPERKRNIGAAIAGSGLAAEAINNLTNGNKEDNYNALSILFVMAKTGEVEPLMAALEAHRTDEIGKAVTKLLSLSGRYSETDRPQENVAKASGGADTNS